MAEIDSGAVDAFLGVLHEKGGTDLLLTAGAPPLVRVDGELLPFNQPPLGADDTERIVHAVLGPETWEAFLAEREVDFSFDWRTVARFRGNAFHQRGATALALRMIPYEIPTFEQLGLPAVLSDWVDRPQGLVLVTGPTGSGKSTTLATMIDAINERHACHIITIEDPIEYYHRHQKGIVNQREIGVDVPSFAEGLRRALRQDPDVILVGEMRDLPTMETAITAAETGHLVFSTLHTTGAARTVDRIIDAFPNTQQEQIRVQLATNLKAVLSQILLPRIDKPGRIAAFELMVNTPSIAALIRDNKTFRISNDILTGSKYGMVSLDASLAHLYLEGYISYEQVMTKAQDPQAAAQIVGGQKPRKR
jgi:twitching motility protein PilT